ncbi:hypothetical protein BD413DRAFT_248733 [Trametes elegans]|nr:hypothetical protein BD413DRAFT_248733 [Trametes elegans]
MIRQEESRARKVCFWHASVSVVTSPEPNNHQVLLQTTRTHLDRITALAHARQAATFNPEFIAPSEKEKTEKKIRRRVSMGVAVDAETGEVTTLEPDVTIDPESASTALRRRHSMRTHTVANTTATVSRVRDEERKQSSAPKRTKTKIKALTQAQLISRALDMEEGNIEEHKNYLTVEEEKRRKARVVRKTVEGPLLRWISKAEEIVIRAEPSPPPPLPPPPPPPPASNPYVPYYSSYTTSRDGLPVASVATGYSYSYPPPYHPSTQQPPFQQWPPPAAGTYQWPPPTMYQPPPPPPPPPPSREPTSRKEKVAKQYVVHELEQDEKAQRPPWSSTMAAMFGKHVDWERMRVYTTKGRPLGRSFSSLFSTRIPTQPAIARPVQICPITGQPARYLDPRTNVPYADLGAYRVLSGVLRHEYVWSATLGCYVSKEGSVFQNEMAA